MSPALRQTVEAALGVGIVATEPLTGGQANQVSALQLDDDRRVVLRLHPRTDGFAGGDVTLARMASLELPVPERLASGFEEETSWQVLSWTPGIELRWALPALTREQQTRIAEQIVGFQRRVMSLPQGRGFGYVPPGTDGTHATWHELIGPSEVPPEIEEYLSDVAPTCFLDDITGKNVIVESGALSGLIDLDNICYGDPLFWMALTRVGLLSDIGEAGTFYAGELLRLWSPDELETSVLAFYSARIAADFIGWYSAHEPPEWQARMYAAKETWEAISRRGAGSR